MRVRFVRPACETISTVPRVFRRCSTLFLSEVKICCDTSSWRHPFGCPPRVLPPFRSRPFPPNSRRAPGPFSPPSAATRSLMIGRPSDGHVAGDARFHKRAPWLGRQTRSACTPSIARCVLVSRHQARHEGQTAPSALPSRQCPIIGLLGSEEQGTTRISLYSAC